MNSRRLISLVLLLIPFALAAQVSGLNEKYVFAEPASSSVLSSGTWFKMKVYTDGIYRLTYEELTGMGFSNPGDVRIFGNGGTMLPLVNSHPRYDDLIENTVYMYNGSDDTFNQGDYILFYCHGPVTWRYKPDIGMFIHQMHQYSEASYYFVTTDAGAGKRMNMASLVPGTASYTVNTFDDYAFHEKAKYNMLKSGRQWLGERIDFTPFDSTFVFDGLVTDFPVKTKINLVSRSGSAKTFSITSSNAVIGSIHTGGVYLLNKEYEQAKQKAKVFSFAAADNNVNLKISYNKTSSNDEAYLDYIDINARRALAMHDNSLFFRDNTIAGTNSIAQFSISNCTPSTEVWDITDPFNITRMQAMLSGNMLSFTDSTTILKQYVALNTDAVFPAPIIDSKLDDVGMISNQNLHSLGPHEMLIVTHPLFSEAADSIAGFHRDKDNMSVFVATTEQIYNEFSSGAPDVSAIRDFIKMLYDRSVSETAPKYLLLIGDGSYNNLSMSKGNVNYILTYQSDSSLNAAKSYVSDDFFGFMGDNEGGTEEMEKYSLDIGIGRLPVKTAHEAMDIYRKIKNYNSYKNKGDWQNNILFVADDQDNNTHIEDADVLADMVAGKFPQFTVKKIFMDAYPQVSSSSGSRYPEVNRMIRNNIEKGLLIFNYTGHGGELGLADERILMSEDLRNLTNSAHLPLFITATCEFSRFDDLTRDENGTLTESTSAGELSLLNPGGGSIALFTTTRIVFSSENNRLNTMFYNLVFNRDPSDNFYSLGDVARMAKNRFLEKNKLNFILLGDPALKLAIPNYKVVTDSLNHVEVNSALDTLKAFSHITISGHIEDHDSILMSDFNGFIVPSVFDKRKTITTLSNDKESPIYQFTTSEDILFKGKVSVHEGRFTFEFRVPKDITYNYGNGVIRYFSYSSDYDANGQFSNFLIGGTDKDAESDNTGPEISLYLNDEEFNNRGITNSNPMIYAKIRDESGINTTGNGIGHDISGIIDGDVSNPVIMNEHFEADLDSYQSGTLKYTMQNLVKGPHSLKIKVWDIYNNSSEQTIEFNVITGEQIVISRAFNYPNPASDHTTFIFEHNKPDEELSVTISVLDIEGRIVSEMHETVFSSGFNTSLGVWDLRDSNGTQLKQGIYVYRIRVSDNKGSVTESYRKLAVIR